ncbi:hypothetical protein VHUM_01748 [Vanrija humicola]|uniref:Galactose oxidase-like Early set domain-containing protein n=1 Tax=Vanrija humicola TaxID=5417 RepID=A0A7D8Z1J8_VANHU|nr:hypothetical protein VHUM_01748 [Vanrija humicola]
MTLAKNPFCAGGTSLGDSRWLVVGGQNAETGSAEGRKAIRLLDPRIATPYWDESTPALTTNRWYTSVETLEDGSAIIIGGSTALVYVNSWAYDNPTYEFYPSRGAPKRMKLLSDTTQLNLYAITWLMPSGKLFIQSGKTAALFDYNTGVETRNFANVPFSVRVYPGSAASTSLPQTPENGWDLRVFICGGTNSNWSLSQNVPAIKSDNSCISISPDKGETAWTTEDPMDLGRVMGEFVNLPDGRLFLVNGAHSGTAGYSGWGWPIGESLANNPAYEAKYYDHSKPRGQRWSSAGTSTIPRMYHSTAVLLPDGSVAIAGSNPNGSYQSSARRKFFSDGRIEYFYPDYYNKPRPKPVSLPTQLKYGGNWFNVPLTATDLNGAKPESVKAVIVRSGFVTHSLHMGQRHVELKTSYTATPDGGLTLHVSQVPPNPAILAPGPALLFIVVNGVPSPGQFITVGDGVIGKQSIAPVQELPPSGSNSVVPQPNGGPLPTAPLPAPSTNVTNPVPSNVISAHIGTIIAPPPSSSSAPAPPTSSNSPATAPPAASSAPPAPSSAVPPAPSSAAPPAPSSAPPAVSSPPPVLVAPPPSSSNKPPATTAAPPAPNPPPSTTTQAAAWSPSPWSWPTDWSGPGKAGYKRDRRPLFED